MEFNFKKNIKIVVNFEIGEEILIKDWGYKLDGKHTIEDVKTNFGGSQSGIMVKVSGYDSFIDIGWLSKLDVQHSSQQTAINRQLNCKYHENNNQAQGYSSSN